MEMYKDPYTGEVVHVTGNQQVDLSGFAKTESNVKWYVDAVNGDDNNDGKTPSTAKKGVIALLDALHKFNMYMMDEDGNPKMTIYIYLAPGDYGEMNLQHRMENTNTGIKIIGDIDNPEPYKIGIVSNIGTVLQLEGVNLCSKTNNQYRYYNAYVLIKDCYIGHNIWNFMSYISFSGNIRMYVENSSAYRQGRICCAFGNTSIKGITKFTISNQTFSNSIFLLNYTSNLEFELKKENVVYEGGGLSDYTGLFITLYDRGQIIITGDMPKAIFPNCRVTTTSDKAWAIPDSMEHRCVVAPIIQPHNISIDKDKADCHPMEAITGLTERLDGLFQVYSGKTEQELIDISSAKPNSLIIASDI